MKCDECNLTVEVENEDRDEYEDEIIKVCPLLKDRIDEIDPARCPLKVQEGPA